MSLNETYKNDGYVVIPGAIATTAIDKFLSAYEDIKRSRTFVYYSQSTHLFIRPALNRFDYIIDSMQSASRLGFFSEFTKAMCEVLYSEGVSDALAEITGEEQHVSWQNMFFDRSTGTVDHQDSWYLDTEPAGDLLGVWYALEDIHSDCGPFYVYPETHKIGLLDRSEYPSHEDFVDRVQEEIRGVEPHRMTINKGDIIVWHPYLIHGAFNCSDESLSRKSFTSHFYPASKTAKQTDSDRRWLSMYNHQAKKPTWNKNILTANRYPDWIYNLLVYGMYAKSLIKQPTRYLSMRRDAYAARLTQLQSGEGTLAAESDLQSANDAAHIDIETVPEKRKAA